MSSSQWRDTHAGGEEGTRGQWRSRGQHQPRDMDEREKQPRQQKDTVPEGACQTMCPARELRDRERQNRLHRFEMLAGTEQDRLPRGDPSRAVKEYSRPAAGKDSTDPSDLRTPEVLLTTVCYLIDNIVASSDLHPWTEASRSLILTFCSIQVISSTFSKYIDVIFLFVSPTSDLQLCLRPATLCKAGYDHPAGVGLKMCGHPGANGSFPHLCLL